MESQFSAHMFDTSLIFLVVMKMWVMIIGGIPMCIFGIMARLILIIRQVTVIH